MKQSTLSLWRTSGPPRRSCGRSRRSSASPSGTPRRPAVFAPRAPPAVSPAPVGTGSVPGTSPPRAAEPPPLLARAQSSSRELSQSHVSKKKFFKGLITKNVTVMF